MNTETQLWYYAHTILGIAVTGFFFILKWLRDIDSRSDKLEQELQRTATIQEDIKNIFNSLKTIETSIIGDHEKKGLLTKHDNLKTRFDRLEEKVVKHLDDE